MAVIGTFGQFTTARLAIYASQASLSVTGNNIANINTAGYTRQRMDLVSLYSTGQGKYANIFNTNVGYGVLTRGATQLRDPYLDIRYRNENSKLGANDEKYNGLSQIASILDEVGKGDQGFGVIEAQFGKLMEALQNENTNAGSEEYDKLVRSAASVLTTYFNKAADDLSDIKENKVHELQQSLSEVNKLLTEIRDLNVQIRTQNIYGDKALELKDARNLALDKLSGYMHIEVTYSMERIDQFSEVEKLTVSIAGSKGPDGKPIKLVDGIYGGQITMPSKMPKLNPNASEEKIVAAMQKVREEAEKNNPISNWTPGIDAAMVGITQAIEDANKMTDEPWKTQLDDALAKLPADAKQEDIDAATAKVDKKRQDFIAEQVAGERAKLQSAAVKQQQDIVNQAVEDERKLQEGIFGRYIKDDGTITSDWDEAVKGDDDGYFNFDEKDSINADSRYLMRVEQLVDQRGRVMEDKGNPSGKSEAVALTDTTLCGSYTNADGTLHSTTALGSLQAIREMLTREGEYSSMNGVDGDLDRDPQANVKRGIPYYERALDNLAKEFARVFNEMNQLPASTVYKTNDDGEFIDADGNVITDKDGNNITLDMVTKVVYDETQNPPVPVEDENGNIVREPKNDEEGAACLEILRQKAAKVEGYGYYDGGVLLSNRGDNNNPNGITAANISISKDWGNHTVRLLNTKEKSEIKDGVEVSHTTRRDNITHIIGEFTAKRDFYAQDVQPDAHAELPVFYGSFQEVFTAISGVLADDAQATGGKLENYSLSTLDLENNRQSVSGVDLNDEATSMMQFSKSYSAACRLLTTIDSMLDTLINGTAR